MKIKVVGVHVRGEASSLVRILNTQTNRAFHVAQFEENGDIEIYLSGEPLEWKILSLENWSKEPETQIEKENTMIDIASSKNKSTLTEKVLELVRMYPFRTSRELARKANIVVLDAEQIHKRLPDLAKAGKVIFSSTLRKCTVTNRMAKTWAIASAPTAAVAE